jgi:hypothetical protein
MWTRGEQTVPFRRARAVIALSGVLPAAEAVEDQRTTGRATALMADHRGVGGDGDGRGWRCDGRFIGVRYHLLVPFKSGLLMSLDVLHASPTNRCWSRMPLSGDARLALFVQRLSSVKDVNNVVRQSKLINCRNAVLLDVRELKEPKAGDRQRNPHNRCAARRPRPGAGEFTAPDRRLLRHGTAERWPPARSKAGFGDLRCMAGSPPEEGRPAGGEARWLPSS